jgi:hypothetical protein
MATLKKDPSDIARRVRVLDNDATAGSTLIVKLYKLDAALAEPFLRDGQFSFRIAFDKYIDGLPKMMHRSRCPIISMDPNAILQTENETAQRMLENFSVPTKTVRNGETRPAGKVFIDVTSTETSYDIDLDEIFDTV